jgi:hypothetical protein
MYLVLADSIWSTIWMGVLEGLLPLLAAVITAALTLLIKKGIDRIGVAHSKEVDDMIDKYVGIGVDYAKKLATNKLASGSKLAGEDKMALAVKTVMGELQQSGVTGVTKELVIARIEALLQNDPKVETS